MNKDCIVYEFLHVEYWDGVEKPERYSPRLGVTQNLRVPELYFTKLINQK